MTDKMINRTLKITDLKSEQAGLARLGRCPSQCQLSKLGLGDLFKLTALLKSNFCTV